MGNLITSEHIFRAYYGNRAEWYTNHSGSKRWRTTWILIAIMLNILGEATLGMMGDGSYRDSSNSSHSLRFPLRTVWEEVIKLYT